MYSKNYDTIHDWINRHYGKAYKCENKNCPKKPTKRFEWSLKKGKKYDRKIENFWQLCKSCHIKYDFTENTRKRMSKSRKKNPPWNKGKILGKQPDWLIEKRVEGRKGYRHSQTTKDKIRKAHLGKKVEQRLKV